MIDVPIAVPRNRAPEARAGRAIGPVAAGAAVGLEAALVTDVVPGSAISSGGMVVSVLGLGP